MVQALFFERGWGGGCVWRKTEPSEWKETRRSSESSSGVASASSSSSSSSSAASGWKWACVQACSCPARAERHDVHPATDGVRRSTCTHTHTYTCAVICCQDSRSDQDFQRRSESEVNRGQDISSDQPRVISFELRLKKKSDSAASTL